MVGYKEVGNTESSNLVIYPVRLGGPGWTWAESPTRVTIALGSDKA